MATTTMTQCEIESLSNEELRQAYDQACWERDTCTDTEDMRDERELLGMALHARRVRNAAA